MKHVNVSLPKESYLSRGRVRNHLLSKKQGPNPRSGAVVDMWTKTVTYGCEISKAIPTQLKMGESLNTGLSCQNTLVGRCGLGNLCTTEMQSATTTELKICNSFSQDDIRGASNALTAGKSLRFDSTIAAKRMAQGVLL